MENNFETYLYFSRNRTRDSFTLSCATEQEQENINNPTLTGLTDDTNAAPLIEEVNLESMYEDEVRKLATKTPIQIITAIEGTSKVIVEAEFRRAQTSGYGFPLYECVLTDEAVQAMGGLAQGMSGSPVGPPGKVFGALAYADAWTAAPHRFWVTPIDAMEATLDHTTFGEFLNPPPAAPSILLKVAYGQESFIPIVAATTLDAIRMEVSDGTIEANVVISFKETDNVYTESFRTISPDPYESVIAYMDVIVESFTNMLSNGAGRTTIDEINISMVDIPQFKIQTFT